jgi:hypothetical protein
MTITATVLGILACVAIAAIGTRFLLQPTRATSDFGVQPGDARALTAIKGVRDLTSGLVPAVALAAAGQTVFGWTLIAAALTPFGDMLIVLARRGPRATAFGVHGLTALVVLALGVTLVAST